MSATAELYWHLEILRKYPLPQENAETLSDKVIQDKASGGIKDIFIKVANGEIPNPLTDATTKNDLTLLDMQNLIEVGLELAEHRDNAIYLAEARSNRTARNRALKLSQIYSPAWSAMLTPVYDRIQEMPDIQRSLAINEKGAGPSISYDQLCNLLTSALCYKPDANEEDMQKAAHYGKMFKLYNGDLEGEEYKWKSSAAEQFLDKSSLGDAYKLRAIEGENDPQAQLLLFRKMIEYHNQAIEALQPVAKEFVKEVVVMCATDARSLKGITRDLSFSKKMQSDAFDLIAAQLHKAIEVINTYAPVPEKEKRASLYYELGEVEAAKKRWHHTATYTQARSYYRQAAQYAKLEGNTDLEEKCKKKMRSPGADNEGPIKNR